MLTCLRLRDCGHDAFRATPIGVAVRAKADDVEDFLADVDADRG
jgi:hypothetical protein